MRRALIFVTILCLTIGGAARAQEAVEHDVVVHGEREGEEDEHDQFLERGDYGQPAWAERNRASATTRAYVLSPFELFAGNVWKANVGNGQASHELVQEIDFGLPHRLELG